MVATLSSAEPSDRRTATEPAREPAPRGAAKWRSRWRSSAASGVDRDLAGYREYMVSQEVGHALGESHLSCPGAGLHAPVMMQQTKGLDSCRTSPWPLEDEAGDRLTPVLDTANLGTSALARAE